MTPSLGLRVSKPDIGPKGPFAAAARIASRLHVERGRLWIDWKHGEGELGWARLVVSGWSEIGTVPWLSGSWLDVEQTRRVIRRMVLPH